MITNINNMNNFNDIEYMHDDIKKKYVNRCKKIERDINRIRKQARTINLCLLGLMILCFALAAVVNIVAGNIFHDNPWNYVSYRLVLVIGITLCALIKLKSKRMQVIMIRKIKSSRRKYMKKLCRDMVYNYSLSHNISDDYAAILMRNSYNMLRCIPI